MKFRSGSVIAGLITAAALVLTGCAGGGAADSASESATGGTLTLGSLVDIKSFDPAQAHLGHQMPIYQAVYDTLILREPAGDLVPMLATEWSYNDDNTVLTLTLRDDVTFTDGEKLDASAVKANLDHFKSANGPDSTQVALMSDVAVVDPTTVAITLSAADPAFTYYLSQAAGFMGSPKAIGTDAIVTNPVGSGPYVLDVKNTVAGSQFSYIANDDYWNDDLQKYDKVVVKVLIDITARTNALVSGQVDAALLDPKTGKQAEGAGLKLTAYATDWQGLLLFDRDGAVTPALGELKVRQAINYAFDRKTMLDQLLLGQGTVTNQVFGDTTDAYVDALDSTYDYDPAKAKKLLAEAGYPDGFTLKLPALAGTEAIMAVVVQQLGDVGITVEQESVPPANYVADLSAAKYSAAWFSIFQGEPWVAIKQMIGPNSVYNPFKSTSPELQSAIDAVQAGGEESGTLAQEVNQIITDEAWFVPWFRVNQMYYSDSKKVTVEPQVQQAVPNIYNYTPVG